MENDPEKPLARAIRQYFALKAKLAREPMAAGSLRAEMLAIGRQVYLTLIGAYEVRGPGDERPAYFQMSSELSSAEFFFEVRADGRVHEIMIHKWTHISNLDVHTAVSADSAREQASGYHAARPFLGLVVCMLVILFGSTAQAKPDKHIGDWGFPEGTVLEQEDFVFAFDGSRRAPRWTLEYLTPETIAGDAERRDNFYADKRIPAHFRATLADFRNSGDDKGHTAACGNYGSQAARDGTFILSAITLQNSVLNQGYWGDNGIEGFVRQMVTGTRPRTASALARAWVFTVPLFTPHDARKKDGTTKRLVTYRVFGPHDVAEPTGYAKVVLALYGTQKLPTKLWAVMVPNRAIPRDTPIDRYRVTVRDVETAAGLNLFSELPEELQDELETTL